VTRWKCRKCPYVYDPKQGDPDGGIPPGTPFSQIPADWVCPVCGASKRDFVELAGEKGASARPAPPVPPSQPPATVAAKSASPAPPDPAAAAIAQPDRAWTVGSL